MTAEMISAFPLFARLPREEIDFLVNTLAERVYAPGTVLFSEGASSHRLVILLEGDVEVIKALGTADERLISVLGKGSVFGEISLFMQDGRHTASVRSLTQVTLLEMTLDQFDMLLHRHPALAYDLLRVISLRLVESERMTIADLREKNRQLTEAYLELQAAQAEMIEKKKLEHELAIAGEMQQNVLPQELPDQPNYRFGALMIPARLVGGDFYDFIPLTEHKIGVVIGDVCDKGMPAALFMALTYSSLRAEAHQMHSPGETLRAVNEHLVQMNRSNMFVTLLYGILDCTTGSFQYARAGHPPPLVLDRENCQVPVTVGRGMPVGLFDILSLDEQVVTIPPGGTMLLYSDGLSESLESDAHSPSLPDLCTSLLVKHPVAQELCSGLWNALGATTSESLIQDDFTVVVLQNTVP